MEENSFWETIIIYRNVGSPLPETPSRAKNLSLMFGLAILVKWPGFMDTGRSLLINNKYYYY
jgi:hypothetical protein